MVTVAIAGGTGGLGQAIVRAVNTHNHDVFVLSRRILPTESSGKLRHLTVDYVNVDQLRSILRDYNIEVVISTIILTDYESAKAQINLIRAAAQSGTVASFIPTEYHVDYHIQVEGVNLEIQKFQLEAEEELLQHAQLSWTLLRCGVCLDHLGFPFKPKPSYLEPFSLFVDLRNEKCVLPGDGEDTLVLSHTADIAACMERLISLPGTQWPRETCVASSKIKVKELERIVKELPGNEIEVIYEPLDVIRKGDMAKLPSNEREFRNSFETAFYSEVYRAVMLITGCGGYQIPGTDLSDLFPDVGKTNVEDFLRDCWKLKCGGL